MKTLDFGDFKMTVRDDFGIHTVVMRSSESSKVKLEGREATFSPTLVLMRSERALKDKAELEVFVEATLGMLRAAPGFQEVSRKDLELQSGAPAVLQRHKFTNEHGLKVEQLQIFVLQKGPALIGTATDLAGEPFAAKEKDYRVALLSLAEA